VSRARWSPTATDSLATVEIPVAETGLPRGDGYRLQDVWTGTVRQARSTIAAAVPAHGTVVYRVRPLRDTSRTERLVTAGAALGTLVPGAEGGTLTNRGAGAIRDVEVGVRVPEGRTVTPNTPTRQRKLPTDAALATEWTVTAPANTYPIVVTADYTWGRRRGTSTSELIATVGTALLTIAGRLYTRGLGTTAPSEVTYYLGGRRTHLVTDVGLDDETAAAVPATFEIRADDTVVATASDVRAGEPARTLTADLGGATWLRLVATGSGAAPDGTTINDHADWAAPVLTCGSATPADPVLPAERTLFSFEDGTAGWTIANPGDGGTVAGSTAFHTDGEHGLAVTTPLSGKVDRSWNEPHDHRVLRRDRVPGRGFPGPQPDSRGMGLPQRRRDPSRRQPPCRVRRAGAGNRRGNTEPLN